MRHVGWTSKPLLLLGERNSVLLSRFQIKYKDMQHTTLPLVTFGIAENRLEGFF